jgi:hypothetical protein
MRDPILQVKFLDELRTISEPLTTMVRGRLAAQSTLFHYTTADGLVGILSEKKIRATNIRYLNDRSELVFAADQIRDVIDKNMPRWCGAEIIIRDALARFLDLQERTDYYVACFCADGNLLNQWRTYGAAGGGYSIGFNMDGLIHALSKQPVDWLLPIVYDPSTAQELVLAACDRARDLWIRWNALPDGGAVNPTANCTASLAVELMSLRSVFKHHDFSPESEYRIIVEVPGWRTLDPGSIPPLRFRTKNGIVVPYVDFPLSADAANPPVTSIRIGPTADRELSLKSVQMLLKLYGYEAVTVDASEIPIRGW